MAKRSKKDDSTEEGKRTTNPRDRQSASKEELLEQTTRAREACMRQLGEITEGLSTIVTDADLGRPGWPSVHEAWRGIRSGERMMIVSDGLSDPFYDESEPNTGLGIEVLVETAEPVDGPLESSWLFALIRSVCRQATAHGGFRELIDELGLFTMEIRDPGGLRSMASSAGHVGLLLGLQSPGMPLEWDLPAGLVKVVTVKVLKPSELAYVVKHDEAGRERLRELFTADGSYHLSALDRPSVIPVKKHRGK